MSADDNVLFQYSVVSALMDGVASKGLPLSTLLSHGDHGLGTFRHMVGEMIILDGAVYQMRSDGSVVTIDPTTHPTDKEDGGGEDDVSVTPFAMITRFRPDIVKNATFESKSQLSEFISGLLPGTGRNTYASIRLDGRFKNVKVRTVGGQTHPREGLTELGQHQTTQEVGGDKEGIEGTVVGFRSPAFMQGVSVAGDHLHFVSRDRKMGGHLLALETVGEVEVMLARMCRVVLELPRGDEEFDGARLEADGEGIEKVEG